MRAVSLGLCFTLVGACADAFPPIPEGRESDECFDLLDNDHDGATDCDDSSCTAACHESDCDDLVDSDRDGLTDCEDPDCTDGAFEACHCLDAIDNDHDGLVDCADTSCAATSECYAPPGTMKIAGGTFTQGCDSQSSARPAHEVTVPTFYIDIANPTVGDFLPCVDEGACAEPPSYVYWQKCNYGPEPDITQPIRCVSWTIARSYCKWAGGRLCSESELRFALREGRREMGIEPLADDSDESQEIVADCWRDDYGIRHPNGALELDVPTDGSAASGYPCETRTAIDLSRFRDATCSRREEITVDENGAWNDRLFRCCRTTDAP
ncbi:MAG: hypothetical protein EP329_22600 [Deltaproteobacteria bacterium]|nr:MAG: hypothetical protein EP329_22600 [Deltaproteobacteria bacterium]